MLANIQSIMTTEGSI